MISPQDIRTVTFDKSMRGYRVEDVDAFLQQAASDMEQLTAEKAEVEQKLYILAQKIEEYRKDEDNLKTALLNAQRMGENVIKEAKQKAESILREAGIKAEDMTRSAQEKTQEEELELERVKAEVAQFKNNVLGLYKEHIESLTKVPGDEEIEAEEEVQTEELSEAAEEQPMAQPFEEPEKPTQAAEEIPQPTQQETVNQAVENIIDSFPDLAALYDEQPEDGKGDADETIEQPDAPEIEPVAPKAPANDAFSGFQGIKFSD